MSNVTNVILSFSIIEEEYELQDFQHYKIMDKINQWLYDSKYGQFSKELTEYAGGNKVTETPIYIAAFNHFNIDAFVEFIKTLNWEEPEDVQIFIQTQDEDRFLIIEPFNKDGSE